MGMETNKRKGGGVKTVFIQIPVSRESSLLFFGFGFGCLLLRPVGLPNVFVCAERGFDAFADCG